MTDIAAELRSRLHLFNTLTHASDAFAPADGERVKLYVCGPTVYSSPHIGNMRTYLFADVLRRVLALTGWQVDAAMNITDVGHLTSDADSGDDKMAAAAKAERATAWDVAARYTDDAIATVDEPATASLRAELRETGVRAVAVHPGGVNTNIVEHDLGSV